MSRTINTSTDFNRVLHAAQAQGLLPETATEPAPEHRPWPVLLLTALGAWLAALPLLAAVGGMLGQLLAQGVGPYIVGTLLLAAAAVVLRAENQPLFVEQLALPVLWVGGGVLAFGLYKDMDSQVASALLAVVALGLSALIQRPWVTVLLGAAAAGLLMIAVEPLRYGYWRRSEWSGALALHVGLLLWLAGLWAQRRVLPRTAGWFESLQAGWLLPVLAGFAWWSGMSFLVGASLTGGDYTGRGAGDWGWGKQAAWSALLPLASASLAAAAALWAARSWPSLRRPAFALAALPLVVLAWWMPALGAVCVALAVVATTQRWRLAAAAGVAAAWIMGAFYYQLAWPLATKALVLVAAGAWLAAAAWGGWRTHRADSVAAQASAAELDAGGGTKPRTAAQALMALGLLTVLGVANVSIWQKEQLIAQGQPMFVALAPVDPRSLMQGDYMRLVFRLPAGADKWAPPSMAHKNPHVVARRDAQGVAQLLRMGEGPEALAAGEFIVQLTPKNGQWVLVSDAWFFKEGEAERWAQARFGEFRVMPDGRALLVGMADAKLMPIRPAP